MRSRLLSVAGLGIGVLVAALWLAGNTGLEGTWPPEPSDPGNVMVWGESWVYSEVDPDFGMSYEPEYERTVRRSPENQLIFIPIAESDLLLALLSDQIGDRDFSPSVQERQLLYVLPDLVAREPVTDDYHQTWLNSEAVDPEEVGKQDWPTARFDADSGRFSTEVAPGIYLACLIDYEGAHWRCIQSPVDLRRSTPIYFTSYAFDGNPAAHILISGFLHIGIEDGNAVQRAIDEDNVLIEGGIRNDEIYHHKD